MFDNYFDYYNILKKINKEKKIAIYPFGKNGLELKIILNENFGINEDLLLDDELSDINKLCKNTSVLDDLEQYQNYLFLLTRKNGEFIRKLLEKGIDEKNIINICNSEEEYVESAIIYLLKKYNVKTMYDYNQYFLKNKFITKDLYSYTIGKLFSDEDLKIFVTENYNLLPIYKSVYNRIEANIYVDLMIAQEDKNTMCEKIIVENINKCKRIAVIVKEKIKTPHLENIVCEKIEYGIIEILLFSKEI